MSMQTIFVMSDEASALSELCAGAGAVAARVTAILFGSEAEAAGAAGCGADLLLYCQPSDGAVPEDYAAAVAQEVKKEASALVIVNNTIRGRCLAGKLGVLLDTAVLTSVNALERSGEELVCCRMVYGGIAQRSEVFTKPYGVLTVGGGVFEAAAEPAQAAVAPFEGLPQGGLKRIACTPKKEGGVDLVAAKRIVDVGRGLAQEADLELCRKLDCGELRYMLQSKKKNGDNTPLYQCLGGTSAEKLRAIGRARPDGKSLSRVAQLVPAKKADFLFVADSGPGETNEKGLIVPKFGNKPENHVAVMMSFESLSEMFLITRMHYQCWLTSWYQQNSNQSARKQGQYSENHKEPDSSSVQMF